MIKLGVIADDFTGATDIASFMAEAGWQVILFNGVPAGTVQPEEADAIVIALKAVLLRQNRRSNRPSGRENGYWKQVVSDCFQILFDL